MPFDLAARSDRTLSSHIEHLRRPASPLAALRRCLGARPNLLTGPDLLVGARVAFALVPIATQTGRGRS